MYIILFFILFLFLQHPIQAQQEPVREQQELDNAHFFIEKENMIELPQAIQIFDNIEKLKIDLPDTQQDYIFNLSIPLEQEISIPYKIKQQEKDTTQYTHKRWSFSVAGGNFATLYAQVHGDILSTQKSNLFFSSNYLHSFIGPVEGEKSAQSTLDTYIKGVHLLEKLEIDYKFIFERLQRNYYGFASNLPPTIFQQNYNILSANFHINTFTEKKLNVDFTADFTKLTDVFPSQETFFSSFFKPSFALSNSITSYLQVLTNVSQQGNQTTQQNQHFDILPSLVFKNENKSIEVGLRFNYYHYTSFSQEKENRFYSFPFVNLSLQLTDKWRFYALLDGGYIFHTKKDIIKNNPYMTRDFVIKPTQQILKTGLTVAYQWNKNILLQLYSKFSIERNKLFFTKSVKNDASFDTFYLTSSNFNLLEMGMLFNYSKDFFYIDFAASYFLADWNQSDMELPWYLPKIMLTTDIQIQYTPKIFSRLQFIYLSNRFAQDPTLNEVFLLPAIPQLNLEANYTLNKNMRFYIKFNNLLSKTYQKYLYYRQQTINFIVGMKYIL